MDGVLDHLPEVLQEAREDHEVTFGQIAVQIGRVENVVRRFERGESAPKFREVDALVAAYADLCDVTPAELWLRAIARAAPGEEGNAAWQRAKALEAGTQAAHPEREE